jgi:hypothetical protein
MSKFLEILSETKQVYYPIDSIGAVMVDGKTVQIESRVYERPCAFVNDCTNIDSIAGQLHAADTDYSG